MMRTLKKRHRFRTWRSLFLKKKFQLEENNIQLRFWV